MLSRSSSPTAAASPLWSITANSFAPFAASTSEKRATVSATDTGLTFVTSWSSLIGSRCPDPRSGGHELLLVGRLHPPAW